MIFDSSSFYNTNEIPKNWKKIQLKHVISFSELRSDDFNNEDILSLTKNGIIVRDIESNEGQIAESYEKYNLVEVGDICMNPMDLLSGWVDISKHRGLISPAYFTLKVKKGFDTAIREFMSVKGSVKIKDIFSAIKTSLKDLKDMDATIPKNITSFNF